MRFTVKSITVLFLTCALYAAGCASEEVTSNTPDPTPVNPFELQGNWYKANFHAHTTTSDGDVDLPTRVEQYKGAGYSILAVTDHEKTNDVTPFNTNDFLLISGMETHPASPNPDMRFHFVCLNVPLELSFAKETGAEERIKTVLGKGGYVIAAHPYWCGFTIEELYPLKAYGVNAMEVYNATCRFCGRDVSSVHWDELLAKGWRLPALAVDDVHNDSSLHVGWTWVRAEALTLDAIMAALKSGAFYASMGPEFKDVRIQDGVVKVECSPVVKIQFFANAPNGMQMLAKDAPLTMASFEPKKKLTYVRVEITDANGKVAWSPALYF
jgi:hypothetical protein